MKRREHLAVSEAGMSIKHRTHSKGMARVKVSHSVCELVVSFMKDLQMGCTLPSVGKCLHFSLPSMRQMKRPHT